MRSASEDKKTQDKHGRAVGGGTDVVSLFTENYKITISREFKFEVVTRLLKARDMG